VISATFQIASYTYGPLLGLFAFGIYTKYEVKDKFVPMICVLSPMLTYALVQLIETYGKYKFGFENLLLNGLITMIGLLLFRKNTIK
jgi:hypothetical protein